MTTNNLTWSAPQGFDGRDIYPNSISALGYTITEIKEEVYGAGSGMYTIAGFELTIGEQTLTFNVTDHGDARGACVAAKQTAQAHHNELTETTETDVSTLKTDHSDIDFRNIDIDDNLTHRDFAGADLSYIEADHMSFVGSDLTGANLTGANLDHCDLTGVNLTGAELSSAKLNGADLRFVSLRGAVLRSAKLNGAKLNGADLRDADLSFTEIEACDLEGVEALDGAILPPSVEVDAFVETSLFSVNGGEPLTGEAILEINDYDDDAHDALVRAINAGSVEGENGVSDIVLVRLRG